MDYILFFRKRPHGIISCFVLRSNKKKRLIPATTTGYVITPK